MMAIEILECDPTFWSDESFFNVDHQTQHSCDVSSKLGSGEPEWGVDDMKQFWDSFELNFNNEPNFQLEVMPNEVECQSDQTKIENQIDISYLDTSAFLSPVSIAPSSPAEQTDDNFEHQLELSSDMAYMSGVTVEEDLNDTSAMDILDKILSAHSSDNEDSQEECLDSAIDAVQYFIEEANESNSSEAQSLSSYSACSSPSIDYNENNGSKRKRQVKRKASEVDSESSGNKRSKRSVASLVEKKERKKNQNKSAANRYRIKKRAEQESNDILQTEQSELNQKLKVQLEKLQMEFKVVYPLAKAAFATDTKRNLLLQMLNIRVLKDNLLD